MAIFAVGAWPAVMEQFNFEMRLAHAFSLRNHLVESIEQADIQTDPEAKQRLLTYVVIGAGAAGVDVVGEISQVFVEACLYYPYLDIKDMRVVLVHGGDRLIADLPERLGEHAGRELAERTIDIRFNERVAR